MSYIRSKDCALYYEEHGSGEPLILLPGLLGTIESNWRRFIPEFAARFHVIAPDLRSHGKTDNPSGSIRLHTLVTDLFTLYEDLEIDAARICGYSLGGYIGLAFGLQHPGRVRSLVMHATKFYWTPEAVTAAVQGFNAETIAAKVPQWASQLRSEHSAANGDDGWRKLLDSAGSFIETMPVEGVTENALKLADFPVLVSTGDSDEMIPREESERLSRSLPNGTLSFLSGTRHSMHTVPKSQFIETTLSFFGTADRGVPGTNETL